MYPVLDRAGSRIPADSWILFSDSPILLGISNDPLTGPSVPLSQVSQLLSTFAWDAEICSAEFLLLEGLVADKAHSNMFVTLLFLGRAGLFVAASSVKLSSLPREVVERAPSNQWRVNLNSKVKVDRAELESLSQLNVCAACRAVRICKKCARCQKKSYCSKTCQVQDWKKGHKRECQGTS